MQYIGEKHDKRSDDTARLHVTASLFIALFLSCFSAELIRLISPQRVNHSPRLREHDFISGKETDLMKRV